MKQKHKNTKILFSTTLLFILLLGLASCAQDSPCDMVDCNYGDCVIDTMGLAICDCWDGFEGSDCNICTACGENGNCKRDGNGNIVLDSLARVICQCNNGTSGDSCQFTQPCFDCPTNSQCIDSLCVCDTGYEGDDCITETRAKYLGTYAATSDCDTSNFSYNCTITQIEGNLLRLAFSNFGDLGNGIYGTILSSTDFVIPFQNDAVGNLVKSTNIGIFEVTGNQVVRLHIAYNVASSDSVSTDCQLTLVKQ